MRCWECRKRNARGSTLWSREEMLEGLAAWVAEHGRTPTMLDWKRAGYGHPNGRTASRRFGSWEKFLEAGGRRVAEGKTPRRHDRYAPWWTPERIAEAMLDWLLVHGRWPKMSDWHHADPDGRWPNEGQARDVCGGWRKAQLLAGRPERSAA